MLELRVYDNVILEFKTCKKIKNVKDCTLKI